MTTPRLGRRLAVIGCGGSGKSYLARQLSQRLHLPLTHLDALFYDEQWGTRAPDDFAARQRQLVREPAWIIEGNYASTLPIRLAAADTVILLDLPAITCLRGILARHLRNGPGQDPTLGVYNRITPGFLRFVLTYRHRMLPRVEHLIARHGQHTKVIRLRSRTATTAFLTQIEAPTA